MKRSLLISLVFLLSGCSWTNHLLDRNTSGKDTTSIAINGQAQGPVEFRFAKKLVRQEDGTIREVLDESKLVAEFPFTAEDGRSFLVECPQESIELCSKISGGEYLKVGGFRGTPLGVGTISATYVRRK